MTLGFTYYFATGLYYGYCRTYSTAAPRGMQYCSGRPELPPSQAQPFFANSAQNNRKNSKITSW